MASPSTEVYPDPAGKRRSLCFSNIALVISDVPTTSIEINLSAIDANLQSLKKSAGSQKLMAVVKANAYGHGATRVAARIEDTVDAFAVAFTEEAVELRESGTPLLSSFWRARIRRANSRYQANSTSGRSCIKRSNSTGAPARHPAETRLD